MTLSEPALRWSGLANVVGGVLLALFFVLHPGEAIRRPYKPF